MPGRVPTLNLGKLHQSPLISKSSSPIKQEKSQNNHRITKIALFIIGLSMMAAVGYVVTQYTPVSGYFGAQYVPVVGVAAAVATGAVFLMIKLAVEGCQKLFTRDARKIQTGADVRELPDRIYGDDSSTDSSTSISTHTSTHSSPRTEIEEEDDIKEEYYPELDESNDIERAEEEYFEFLVAPTEFDVTQSDSELAPEDDIESFISSFREAFKTGDYTSVLERLSQMSESPTSSQRESSEIEPQKILPFLKQMELNEIPSFLEKISNPEAVIQYAFADSEFADALARKPVDYFSARNSLTKTEIDWVARKNILADIEDKISVEDCVRVLNSIQKERFGLNNNAPSNLNSTVRYQAKKPRNYVLISKSPHRVFIAALQDPKFDPITPIGFYLFENSAVWGTGNLKGLFDRRGNEHKKNEIPVEVIYRLLISHLSEDTNQLGKEFIYKLSIETYKQFSNCIHRTLKDKDKESLSSEEKQLAQLIREDSRCRKRNKSKFFSEMSKPTSKKRRGKKSS